MQITAADLFHREDALLREVRRGRLFARRPLLQARLAAGARGELRRVVPRAEAGGRSWGLETGGRMSVARD